MTIKDRLDEWEAEVKSCSQAVQRAIIATETIMHSMTAFEYCKHGEDMPEMYGGGSSCGHAVMDTIWSEDNLTMLEDDGILHAPPGVHEAYAELSKLAFEEKFDAAVMDPAYSKIINFFLNEAPKQIAIACVPKGDNPYPKPRPLAPLTKKELEDKIADMKLRIDLEKDPNRRLQYRSALRSYEERLKELH